MKNFFIALFLTIIVISVVFFNALDNRPAQMKQNARLIVVQYYTNKCTVCQELNHKMHKINWLLGKEPIIFLRYDQSNLKMLQDVEKQLQSYGILNQVQKEKKPAGLSVFAIKTKKKLMQFDPNEDAIKIESTLRKLLKITE